ncbi:MAG TPA: hypothetical protein VI893_06195 [Thermoplasmata archaeon]|nr:hypothetical protein [Thermoplasmata archaeon]
MRVAPRQRNLLEVLAMAGPLVASVILGLIIPHAHNVHDPEVIRRGPAEPEQYSIWEAFGKGLVSLNYSHPSMTAGSAIGGFRIQNLADKPVVVPNSEFPLILSPNPLEFRSPEPGEPTTQDAILTPAYIPPLSNVSYAYGAAVSGTGVPAGINWGKGSTYSSFPPWWCAEITQFTAFDTPVYLSGHTVPKPIVTIATDPDPALDVVDAHLISLRQRKIWDFLNDTATVVVGKKPLVKDIEPKLRTAMNVTLAATNLGFTATGRAIVADVIPPGFGMVEGSFAPAPTRVVKLFDGGQRVEWDFPFPGGIRKQDADTIPTKYFTQFFTYQLVVPELDFGARYFLPPALSDSTADGDFEARSAPTLLESVEITILPAKYDFPSYPWWLFVAMVGATFAIALVLREQGRWGSPGLGPLTPSGARTTFPGVPAPGQGIEPPPSAVFGPGLAAGPPSGVYAKIPTDVARKAAVSRVARAPSRSK